MDKKFCQCDACIVHSEPDPLRPGKLRRGSTIPRKMFVRHQRTETERHLFREYQGKKQEREEQRSLEAALMAAMLSTDASTETLPARTTDFASQSSTAVRNQRNPSPKPSEIDIKRLNQELDEIQSDIDLRTSNFDHQQVVVFPCLPLTTSDPVPSIAPHDPRNHAFVAHFNWLHTMLEIVDSALSRAGVGKNKDRDTDGKCGGMRKAINRELQSLDELKSRCWTREMVKAGLMGPVYDINGKTIKSRVVTPMMVDTERFFNLRSRLPSEPFLLAILAMVVGLHVICAVSRVDSELILATFRVGIAGALMYKRVGPDSAVLRDRLLADIPKSMATTLRRFDIEPEIEEYACCPQCFAIYAPVMVGDGGSRDPTYPDTCTWTELDGPPCGGSLVTQTKGKTQPRKTFGIQTPISWLARLLSREPILEQYMEQAWSPTRPSGSKITDIFDADVLQNFKGPDGRSWAECPNDELHLIFSMFVDWFNPYGNKQSGKSNSIGAIYMVCLSLPAAIRYKAENMYLVCIIPGPKEPSVTQLNHLLKPIVDQFLKLWQPGVRFSRTAAKRFGRVVKCAIVPVVCDLPALRKTAGFAGHAAHNFCSFCRVRKNEIADDFDCEHWPRRDWEEHTREARRWRDATSHRERETIFNRHGLRWSELLRLPYWDPTRFTVLDAMHNLFLGEYQHHCRRVWGLSIKAGKKANKVHSPHKQLQELQKGVDAMKNGQEKKLMRLRKGYLIALAHVNGVETEGTFIKENYAKALLDWYQAIASRPIVVPPVMSQPASEFVLEEDDVDDYGAPDISSYSVLGSELLKQVHLDMADTTLPSWIQPGPSNFGSPSHGKLKADEWRTVCSVNLIITLVRIWGRASATIREKGLLQNYTDLVIAITWGTRRSLTAERIAIYAKHMKRYLDTLTDLFGDTVIVPNHHLSLHLIECLRSFGPVHSWWTFPFERYNGMLRHLNTNSKPGQIEKTFLRFFPMGSYLRGALAQLENNWPQEPEYKDMAKQFKGAFDTASRGTLVSDIHSWASSIEVPSMNGQKVRALADPEYDAFLRRMNIGRSAADSYVSWRTSGTSQPPLSNRVQETNRVHVSGIHFSTASSSKGDGYIRFRSPEQPHRILHGRIEKIFLHSHKDMLADETGSVITEPYFIVQEYSGLSTDHKPLDPYSRIPHLEVELFYNVFKEASHVIKATDLVSHFASFVYTPDDIDRECIVAVSLDRS